MSLHGKNGPPVGQLWRHSNGMVVKVVQPNANHPDFPVSEVVIRAKTPPMPEDNPDVGYRDTWCLRAVYNWWPLAN